MFILSRAQNEHESNCLHGQTWPNKDYADSDILNDFSIKYCFFFLFFFFFFLLIDYIIFIWIMIKVLCHNKQSQKKRTTDVKKCFMALMFSLQVWDNYFHSTIVPPLRNVVYCSFFSSVWIIFLILLISFVIFPQPSFQCLIAIFLLHIFKKTFHCLWY